LWITGLVYLAYHADDFKTLAPTHWSLHPELLYSYSKAVDDGAVALAKGAGFLLKMS